MRLYCVFSIISLLLLGGCTSKVSTTDATTETVEDKSTDENSESSSAADMAPDESSSEPEVDIPESLVVGDKAPPIHIAKWVVGDEVSEFEAGKIHVVEFWATWCPPCRSSMPHISGLQEEYGDKVRFIGVTDEDEETVTGFLDGPSEDDESSTWRDVIKYRLAIDDSNLTSQSYMRAAKQSGIPTAFIVGADGILEWIGHPMGIDDPLAQIVDGNWDREAAAAQAKASAALQKALSTGDMDQAITLIDGMLENDKANWQMLATKSQLLSRSDRLDEALDVADEAISIQPEEFGLKMMKYQMLVESERTKEANSFAEVMAESVWDESQELNSLAWVMTTEVPSEAQDLDLALKFADRAIELSPEDSNSLDTLARIHYELGDLEKAIEIQKKAVSLSPGQALQNTLEGYEAELELKNSDEATGESEDSEGDEAEDESSADESSEDPDN